MLYPAELSAPEGFPRFFGARTQGHSPRARRFEEHRGRFETQDRAYMFMVRSISALVEFGILSRPAIPGRADSRALPQRAGLLHEAAEAVLQRLDLLLVGREHLQAGPRIAWESIRSTSISRSRIRLEGCTRDLRRGLHRGRRSGITHAPRDLLPAPRDPRRSNIRKPPTPYRSALHRGQSEGIRSSISREIPVSLPSAMIRARSSAETAARPRPSGLSRAAMASRGGRRASRLS